MLKQGIDFKHTFKYYFSYFTLYHELVTEFPIEIRRGMKNVMNPSARDYRPPKVSVNMNFQHATKHQAYNIEIYNVRTTVFCPHLSSVSSRVAIVRIKTSLCH